MLIVLFWEPSDSHPDSLSISHKPFSSPNTSCLSWRQLSVSERIVHVICHVWNNVKFIVKLPNFTLFMIHYWNYREIECKCRMHFASYCKLLQFSCPLVECVRRTFFGHLLAWNIFYCNCLLLIEVNCRPANEPAIVCTPVYRCTQLYAHVTLRCCVS